MTIAMPSTAPMAVDYGHLEPVLVHFDDLDAMGVLHNARYGLLLERAMVAFWTRHGHSFDRGRPTTTDAFNVVKEFSISYHTPIRGTGEFAVHFWTERVGDSSGVYGFRLLSADGTTVYAQGRRVVIKLDPGTLKPTAWTQESRTIAESLLRPES